MGTIYVLNFSTPLTITLCVGFISLAMYIVTTVRENRQLKLLVRMIDLMAYVKDGLRPYDNEIVEIANKLSISMIKSGNLASRYIELIVKLDAISLGRLLQQHKELIKNGRKKHYLVQSIENNIFEFSASKLATMLLKLTSYTAKDASRIFEPSDSNKEIQKLILDSVYKMNKGSGEFKQFISTFESGIPLEIDSLLDSKVDNEYIKKYRLVFDAEIIKIKQSLKIHGFII